LHREWGYGIIPYITESFCIITLGSLFYRGVLYKYLLAALRQHSSKLKGGIGMFKRIRNWANRNEGLIGLIGLVFTIIGLVGPWLTGVLLSSAAPAIVDLFQRYSKIAVWMGLLLLMVAFVLVSSNLRRRVSKVEDQLRILENLPETLLDEITSANLSNWSYGSDQWTSDQDGLSVTDSLFGGICKIGTTWENYEFAFEFKIMHQCAAWIVRASSGGHYVMIQCNSDQVRPHVLTTRRGADNRVARVFQVVKEVEHGLSLSEWNRARTEVLGHGIKVWINDRLVFSDSELLESFPMGTVGFRAAEDEHVLFRSIKVTKKSI
jgi:hypothetical protein